MGPEILKLVFPEMQDFVITSMRIKNANVNAKGCPGHFLEKLVTSLIKQCHLEVRGDSACCRLEAWSYFPSCLYLLLLTAR